MIFSASIQYRELIFSVQIPAIYEHLFRKYVVRQSVSQATKGIILKTQKCELIGCYLRKKSDLFIFEDISEQ